MAGFLRSSAHRIAVLIAARLKISHVITPHVWAAPFSQRASGKVQEDLL